jgi:peptidoglycan hydrolase-like protein with peptidoglycan-binding domain
MYPAISKELLTPSGLKRFQQAYDEKKRPIGWWEPNKEAAGLVQVFLHVLGYKLPKSVRVVAEEGGTLVPDGIFGPETYAVVKQFQRDSHIKDDGMVGKDTFDALEAAMNRHKKRPHEPSYHNVIIDQRQRPCRPGELICPDPDMK